MTPQWRNPSLSLGLRCVLLAKEELARRVVSAPYGQPNTSPRVREYLAPCLRDLNGNGAVEPTELLGLREGNWCAAFASWCMRECLLPGEPAPHLYRAGVVELVADAQARGVWRAIEDVRTNAWSPHVGDLCIWDRSEPGKPETSWWRHVNRIARWEHTLKEPVFTTIGGNEGRAVRLTDQPPKALEAGKLLGFVSYYVEPRPRELTPEERQNNLNLISAFVREQLESTRKGDGP